ncbi:DUF308 domain-containing protein (plasmid) [Kovacikia minuta CCNUW1]|uniref:HdeD family acid-resistance protein n=1 Tax=Kovacikia minuta TaxID=2931930 RepID=UPI001CCE6AB4|nr:DUF308 domain-containing protein [Kovacikia minuta]UBF30304.1 DUF308 domain-containing protein [Kovacikia minuta CCNUW1]
MTYTEDPVGSELAKQVRAGFGWGVALGIIMMVLGIIAIARPLYITIASALVFGWLFIIAGVIQTFYALRSQGVGQLAWKLLLGILYLIAGLSVVNSPATGAAALTLVLGITIFAHGVIEVILAFQMRPAPNWGWMLLGGIAGIILGIFIWSSFPSSADWIIGLWVGIHLLLNGLWILLLSSAVRAALR